MSYDPLDQIPLGVCGVFQKPAHRAGQTLQGGIASGCRRSGFGDHHQQKGSQCSWQKPTQTQDESLVSGLCAAIGYQTKDEFHRSKRSRRIELAGAER